MAQLLKKLGYLVYDNNATTFYWFITNYQGGKAESVIDGRTSCQMIGS